MSALEENRCYGLSGGKLSRGGNVSVYHVKLTDSAARAIGTFQKQERGLSSHPTICFNGNQGRITIPCADKQNEMRTFTFSLSNVASDNPHASFDCIKQISTGAAQELSCLGLIQKKMTVNATDDSYDKARQSMAQAEEETRSRGAIVIKHGGRYHGKKVRVRAPAPALAKLTKPKHSSHSLLNNVKRGVPNLKEDISTSSRKSVSDVQGRPLRERVKHLLALRPYKRPELILRLQKDGLTVKDKNVLDSVLMEVGQLNIRDSAFVLKDSLYKEVQKDWPGYTSGDQQLLKRILVRRLFQPQQNLLSVPEAQVSPLRDTPNSSPAHRPKHSLPGEYTDSSVSKKPRISHFYSKTTSNKSKSKPSEQVANKDLDDTTDDQRRNSLDPLKLLDSLSTVCQQVAKVGERLELTPGAKVGSGYSKDSLQPSSCRPPSANSVPDLTRHEIKRKKSKHKDCVKEKRRDEKRRRKDHGSGDSKSRESPNCKAPTEILFDSNALQVDDDCADYLSKYTVICNPDQRQSYKQDFNKEYNEYRDLHAHIDTVTQQFLELDSQLKQLHHDSHKYKTVRNQIFQEYRKIKKSNPNYNQDKVRCEYLHNKLAHIKRLISEYDQQQLSVDNTCPN
ncbi:RNA polymerase II elongation factor ELL-like [Pholidichthys leucotaenia]